MITLWLIWIVPPGLKVLAAPRRSATAAAVLLLAAAVLVYFIRRWQVDA